jgi:porin
MSKRALQIATGLVANIPVATGLLGLLGVEDPVYVASGVPRIILLDTNLRFFSGVWLGLSLALFWLIPHVARQIVLFRAIWAMIFIGGIGRLLSIWRVGAPSWSLRQSSSSARRSLSGGGADFRKTNSGGSMIALTEHRRSPYARISVSSGTYIVAAVLCLGWVNAARVFAQANSQPPPFGGPWDSRTKLTGDWDGFRDELRDHGITLDVSATTYYQGTASGGLHDSFEFGGRSDYLLNIDGQKAGLWPGLFINLHGETVYGDSVNLFTGAVVPVNIGRAHPVFSGTAGALTNVRITQALSENFVLYAGKINTIDNVQQPFMSGRGLDAGFMNATLFWNVILARTLNYATLGAGAAVLQHGYPVFSLTVYDTHDDSTRAGFDKLFDNGALIYPTVSLPTKFFGMPGHQSLWGAYSSASYSIVTPESLTLIPQVLQGHLHPKALLTPVRGSWWITYLFDQAFWVDPMDNTRSLGVFGNFGVSDGKPNPIKWSAIAGIGGSSPIPGRKQDSFGLGYYYLGYSDDFKHVTRLVIPVRDERGLELFYNLGVTPWCHITTDLQVITPSLGLAKTSVVLGLRTKVDF